MVFKIFRLAERREPSVVENSKSIANTPCTMHVVGDNDHRRMLFLLEKKLVNLRGGNTVKSAARLIDQKDLRFQN